jgi:pimeloyl-ACP methyl ester carboxylesterase
MLKTTLKKIIITLNSPGGKTITTDELNDCAAFLEEEHGSLEYFRTTYAAYDLDRLIQATRKDDDQVYIYGTSYGTFWLNHFLQVTSQPLDGLIFDGGCGPGDCSFNSASAILGWDATGRRLLRQCAQDERCGSYLPNPEETLAQLYEKLDNEHCSALEIGGNTLFDLVGIMPTRLDLRDYIPSLIYRIDRCEQRDIEALTKLLRPANAPEDEDAFTQHHSAFLEDHIISNEMWIKPAPEFTPEERAKADNRLFGEFTSSKSYIDRMDTWPATYDADEFAGQVASTDVPVLFLQGTLDAQTPLEVAGPFGKNFNGPNQNYIYVYDAGHNVLSNSPLADYQEFSCGMDLIGQFLNDPKSELDTSCTYVVMPLNFDAKELYGTDDAWN